MSNWTKVCAADAIPLRGARVVETGHGAIAVFRDGGGELFAIDDRCPHRGGPLSQGIVFERRVACPLHGMVIALDTGEAVAPDQGCVKTYPVRVDDGEVSVQC
jgi:nitrite reductase (NADH) small subunit